MHTGRWLAFFAERVSFLAIQQNEGATKFKFTTPPYVLKNFKNGDSKYQHADYIGINFELENIYNFVNSSKIW